MGPSGLQTALIPLNLMISIIDDLSGSIRQAIDLLNELPPELFTKTAPPAYESSIGAHLRHNIDHYHSFLEGIHKGRIDYDHRNRDPRVEREASLTKALLEGFVRDLEALSDAHLDRPLEVKMDCGQEATWSQSSGRREVQFLLSHTVHHYAVIALICKLNGHPPPKNFGVAPSTIKFRESQSQTCAP